MAFASARLYAYDRWAIVCFFVVTVIRYNMQLNYNETNVM